jgi:hypothetical protein
VIVGCITYTNNFIFWILPGLTFSSGSLYQPGLTFSSGSLYPALPQAPLSVGPLPPDHPSKPRHLLLRRRHTTPEPLIVRSILAIAVSDAASHAVTGSGSADVPRPLPPPARCAQGRRWRTHFDAIQRLQILLSSNLNLSLLRISKTDILFVGGQTWNCPSVRVSLNHSFKRTDVSLKCRQSGIRPYYGSTSLSQLTARRSQPSSFPCLTKNSS